MSFLDKLKQSTNKTWTENDAVTNISTLNPVLDFFAQAGAMRERLPDAVKLFRRAYAEDPLMALRALFYMRDVRGGQGERDLFRACLKEVPQSVVEKNIEHIPTFGRFDDMFVLKPEVIKSFIGEKLAEDEKLMKAKKSVSLLAKWMPSENTSSQQSRTLARKFAKLFELSASKYRKKIVALRKYIKLLEHKMSANEWEGVDYEKVPSQAMRKHVKAFKRHDGPRYNEFLEAVEKGQKKIKTETLFTYEVFDLVKEGEDKAANALWKNLPDYTKGQNALVVADVSGSMSGRPISISVSLALYFAEHNTGLFKNYFMTFSSKPQLVKVLGKTLTEKLRNIENSEWEMNTDLEAAFDAILEAAQDDEAEASEMPKVLYVISDMEFDEAVAEPNETIFKQAQKKFKAAGYELPHVVFWNVNSRQDQNPATMYDDNVTLISGASQSTFKYAVEGKTPLESMNEILNSERYEVIKV
ncbi:MAG TPA: DUF2828 family protein [Chryseolinea sp.]